jgi:hypothetical protein
MPIALTKPCMSGTGCISQQSVRLRFHIEDGTMVEAGKAARGAPGHDAWVMGDEPAAEQGMTTAMASNHNEAVAHKGGRRLSSGHCAETRCAWFGSHQYKSEKTDAGATSVRRTRTAEN